MKWDFRFGQRVGLLSRPVWGAWIEIVPVVRLDTVYRVAPRMGRVD